MGFPLRGEVGNNPSIGLRIFFARLGKRCRLWGLLHPKAVGQLVGVVGEGFYAFLLEEGGAIIDRFDDAIGVAF